MIDDLVEIPEEKYEVHKTLGLARDKYNLITIDDRFELELQGMIYQNEKALYYHPFLRRFLSRQNNFQEITRDICELSQLENVTLSLAIDPFQMDPKESLLPIVEKDHWWGIKFDTDKLSDPSFQGSTVYKRVRNPNNQNDMSWPIDRIETVVSNQSLDEKSIAIEQVDLPESFLDAHKDDIFLAFGRNQLKYSNTYRLNRFAHFVWNKTEKSFSHFDIAMIPYKFEDLEKRFSDKEFPGRNSIPHAKKIKLMRIDGEIPLEMVSRLLGRFFLGNELIQEWLDGK